MQWFTADCHFGHFNVIASCGRPFSDVAEMNAHMLDAYVARVLSGDDLWVLGDFAIAKTADGGRDVVRDIFRRIPGKKHLILGNHDLPWVKELGWESIDDFKEIKIEGRRVSLSHYPMLTFPGARHGAIQMFGHVHQNWRGSRNSVNVGVDVFDFRPVTLSEVLDRAKLLPVNAHWDEVEPGVTVDGPSISLG